MFPSLTLELNLKGSLPFLAVEDEASISSGSVVEFFLFFVCCFGLGRILVHNISCFLFSVVNQITIVFCLGIGVSQRES